MPSDDVTTVFDLLALPISRFVDISYDKLLGRLPDPAEAKVRASALRSGQGRRRLLADIVESPEFKVRDARLLLEESDETFVARLYRDYLDRKPDPEGLATYVGFLRSGKSRDRIRHDIIRSREARSAGAFWFELHSVVADDRNARRSIGRWMKRSRSLDKRRNQDLEIVARQTIGEETRRYRVDTHVPTDAETPGAINALAEIDPGQFTREARRVLLRYGHLGGIALRRTGTA